MDVLDRLSVSFPVIQAAMGGGISGPELVCAVSRAGGLGSLGHTSIDNFRKNITAIQRELGVRPYCVNLLLPLATKAHIRACLKQRVPVVSIFYGHKAGLVAALKDAGCMVAYQVGSLGEAERAWSEGAEILIVQGCEAGGHLRGFQPLHLLLAAIKSRCADAVVIAAGGIYNGASAQAALDLGADGVAAGTRFLMSAESMAHREYKAKLVAAKRTVVTSLFGFGWHAPHRVLQNKATEAWTTSDGSSPGWLRPINKSAAIMSRHMPQSAQDFLHSLQTSKVPLYTPIAPTERLRHRANVEVSALYAGECVAEINSIEPAANIVRDIGSSIS